MALAGSPTGGWGPLRVIPGEASDPQEEVADVCLGGGVVPAGFGGQVGPGGADLPPGGQGPDQGVGGCGELCLAELGAVVVAEAGSQGAPQEFAGGGGDGGGLWGPG